MTKREFALIFTIMILVVLYLSKCKCSYSPKERVVKVVTDTVWKSSKSDTFYTPQITKTEYVPEYRTDTLETTEYIKVKVDTTAILKDYLATRYYNDSIAVQYGKVYINDTITKNKIKSRGVKTSFNIPVVKEMITLTRPRKNIAYIGFEGYGNKESIIYGVGISAGMKIKNDKYYGVKALVSKEGRVLFGANFMIPIRFKKR